MKTLKYVIRTNKGIMSQLRSNFESMTPYYRSRKTGDYLSINIHEDDKALFVDSIKKLSRRFPSEKICVEVIADINNQAVRTTTYYDFLNGEPDYKGVRKKRFRQEIKVRKLFTI